MIRIFRISSIEHGMFVVGAIEKSYIPCQGLYRADKISYPFIARSRLSKYFGFDIFISGNKKALALRCKTRVGISKSTPLRGGEGLNHHIHNPAFYYNQFFRGFTIQVFLYIGISQNKGFYFFNIKA